MRKVKEGAVRPKKIKKEKMQTPEQIEKRQKREAAELTRRLKMQSRPQYKGYLAILLIFVAVVYIVDEFSSNVNAAIQFEVVKEYIVATGMAENATKGATLMTLMSAPMYLLMVIAPFYKALADRFGRRIFLAINTVGMGIGMLVCMLSTNIYVFILGTLIITFVVPNDIQVMYIMEVAPEKHRAKLCSATKAVGLLGVTFIAVLKNHYMGADVTLWREIYLIPVIIAIVVGLLAYVCLRETPIFLSNRISYLEMSEEERKSVKEKEKTQNNNGGVIKALKFIFKHKQLRALAITGFVFAISTGVTLYYETIMQTGRMTPDAVTTAIFVFPFFNALLTFFSGFMMDKLGRKRAALILASFAFLGLGMFIISSRLGWSAVLVGATYGCFLGGLWSVSDMLFIIMSGESSPTELRASVLGAMSLIFGAGYVISMVLITVFGMFVNYLGWLCFGICMPFMLASILLLTLKVHETKGINLSTVTGEEWDDKPLTDAAADDDKNNSENKDD